MGGPSSEQSTFRKSHRLVEHYTPDGTLGRLLLALASGTLSGGALLFALFGFGTFSPGWVLVGLLASGVGIAAALLTVLVLWPVYLSLIGNVDSPEAYGRPGSASARFGAGVDSTGDADGTEPSEILKRKYAAGEISDAEFERRLDNLLDAEETTRRVRENDPSKQTLRERN